MRQGQVTVKVEVMDLDVIRRFTERVRDFIEEYAWHLRSCAAVDADGEWRLGNEACDCGYDDALKSLVPERPEA